MPPKFLEQCFTHAGYYKIILLVERIKFKILRREEAISTENVTQVLS